MTNLLDIALAGWTCLKTTFSAPAAATLSIAQQYGAWISITVMLIAVALFVASSFQPVLARKLGGHWFEVFAAATATTFVIAVIADHDAITTYGSLATFLVCLVFAAKQHTAQPQDREPNRPTGDEMRSTVYLPTAIGISAAGVVCVLSVGANNMLIAGAIAIVVLLLLLILRALSVANTTVDRILADELELDDDPDPFAMELRIERRDPTDTDTTGETR